MARAMRVPTPTRVRRALRARGERLLERALRSALYRAARATPRADDRARADRRVVILIGSAWGMGGTIRAAHNLAGYLAATGREVQMLSAYQRRDTPFMGEFPAGVDVVALDDQREGVRPRWREALVRALRRPSVLMEPTDIRYQDYSLLTDIQLVRHLRRGAGVLIGTRPSLNILIARLAMPGWITVGEEQMNLHVHSAPLRKEMRRRYGRLDALAVLTERDRDDYREWLDGRAPRLERIPNTVRELDDRRADLGAKVVLAAGRLTSQKGYDMLVPAWETVAAARPDWHLRICGRGQHREKLEGMVRERGLEEQVTLAPAAEDLGAEMERASIYALSSRFEGFPLVLLEAMGKGMAPVAFDCPTGPADIIDDHRNGLLVPFKDVEALGAALLEMIEDEELRRRCGAAAVETARGYTMEAVGPMWDRLLADLRTAARAS
jgi:glycosyltransferase involved in cell wall biosynthesis